MKYLDLPLRSAEQALADIESARKKDPLLSKRLDVMRNHWCAPRKDHPGTGLTNVFRAPHKKEPLT